MREYQSSKFKGPHQDWVLQMSHLSTRRFWFFCVFLLQNSFLNEGTIVIKTRVLTSRLSSTNVTFIHLQIILFLRIFTTELLSKLKNTSHQNSSVHIMIEFYKWFQTCRLFFFYVFLQQNYFLNEGTLVIKTRRFTSWLRSTNVTLVHLQIILFLHIFTTELLSKWENTSHQNSSVHIMIETYKYLHTCRLFFFCAFLHQNYFLNERSLVIKTRVFTSWLRRTNIFKLSCSRQLCCLIKNIKIQELFKFFHTAQTLFWTTELFLIKNINMHA